MCLDGKIWAHGFGIVLLKFKYFVCRGGDTLRPRGSNEPPDLEIIYIYIYIYIYICKDQFRLRSNTGMDPGPRSPNNEFVECGKKS